ncbi:MAG: L,D-transpeptidase family protein [Verrucomicrobiota bacterium]|nr:L,D-transpeptidase family protein [Verrucomicrobiota bacterium]
MSVVILAIALFAGIFSITGKAAEEKPAPEIATPPETNLIFPDRTNPVFQVIKTSSAIFLKTNLNILIATNPPPNSGTRNLNTDEAENFTPRSAENVFEAQLVLARRGISSGSLDGLLGSQTRSAVRAFQHKENLPVTGVLDADTLFELILTSPPFTSYSVTSNDLAQLQPSNLTWAGKAQQSGSAYETILEMVGEKSFSHPNFIQRLNPSVNWSKIVAGTHLQIPNIKMPAARARAAFIRIQLADKILEAFDANSNLLTHFPCSIAARMEKRPAGELHVITLAQNPNYTLDPAMFSESTGGEIKRKLIIPPGPNNPVGTVWIGLDKPTYGIHGTPQPEEVGRTESHGCFRLANWNAQFLIRLVSIGTPVYVEP